MLARVKLDFPDGLDNNGQIISFYAAYDDKGNEHDLLDGS
jgi:hypothetical protein